MNRSAALEVVIGAGPVGTALARRLLGEGKRVRVLTRSGTGLDIPGIESLAVDASDSEALTEMTTGAKVLYNCANPGPYPVWEEQWPPLAVSILASAERTGRAGHDEQPVRARPSHYADDPPHTAEPL